MNISVIEYGLGNVQSVVNACVRLGFAPNIAESGEALGDQNPDRIILPGVGAVGTTIKALTERGFKTKLDELVLNSCVPFLGICVGMQMAEKCHEQGCHDGFGWIPVQSTAWRP